MSGGLRHRSIEVDVLGGVDGLGPLAKLADAEGHRMVSHLIADWRSGANAFDRPGEALFAAAADGSVVGVCGLNVDPYADDESVGRVRRMYVDPAWRREGVGSALVERVLEQARGHFEVLHLRTASSEAAAFYRSQGFADVADDPTCTHRRTV